MMGVCLQRKKDKGQTIYATLNYPCADWRHFGALEWGFSPAKLERYGASFRNLPGLPGTTSA